MRRRWWREGRGVGEANNRTGDRRGRPDAGAFRLLNKAD